MSRNFTRSKPLLTNLVQAIQPHSKNFRAVMAFHFILIAWPNWILRKMPNASFETSLFPCGKTGNNLPSDFSLSTHLYTEVRKAVVQCVNNKLKTSTNIPVIEKQIIPGFSIAELKRQDNPLTATTKNPDIFSTRWKRETMKSNGGTSSFLPLIWKG